MGSLTTDQIEFYHTNGFLLVKSFIDLKTIARIKADTERLHELLAGEKIETTKRGIGITWEDLPQDEAPRIRQLMGSNNVSHDIRAIACSAKMIGAMEQLLGSEVELFHSKLMMKPARKGSFTPWHSDWGYWKSIFKAPTQMNAFLAIDASTLENGCIRYVPGSHRDYIEHQVNPSASGFAIGLPGDIDAFDAVPLEMEPGDVAFHGSITIHASEGNRSECSRIMNTFAYTTINSLLHTQKARDSFYAQALPGHELLSFD